MMSMPFGSSPSDNLVDCRSALLIIDMQEDFCSSAGAYARGGLDISATRALLPTMHRLIETAKQAGVPVFGSLFTVFEDVDGRALTSPHLLAHRPFLREFGFRIGDKGREWSSELPTPTHTVTKPRYSAFYGTPLEILLRDMGIRQLALCGITANGGVAATARDAYLRDIPLTVISDAVASFQESTKTRALQDLGEIARVQTADEWIANLS